MAKSNSYKVLMSIIDNIIVDKASKRFSSDYTRHTVVLNRRNRMQATNSSYVRLIVYALPI